MDIHKPIDCIEETLEAILEAQNQHRGDNQCRDSCEAYIQELVQGTPPRPRKNTIPFVLFCGCEPFKATGFTTHTPAGSNSEVLVCVKTFIFKVISLNGNCAVLELLAFKPFPGPVPTGNPTGGFDKVPSPCFQAEGEKLEDLAGTGICITVDLSCFCAITCLPAVHI